MGTSTVTWHDVEQGLPEKGTTDIGEEYLVELDLGGERVVSAMNFVKDNFYGLSPFTKWTDKVRKWAPMPAPEE